MDKIRAWKAGDDEKQAGAAEVKAWFMKLREMAEAVNTQQEKVQRQRDAATRVTQNFSGMPMAPGNGDKILDAVCRMDNESRELSRMMSELTKMRVEAITRTFCIVYAETASSLRDAEVLRAYYIECETKDVQGNFKLKTYLDISVELGIAQSTVCECIRRGLEALAEIWPDITKSCA